ncbi:MAG: SDR family NAD(P)-dependent oxidoreductase [Planctomycetota bacterium]|nr:SDR family NAD(P)-dependent oxidoreductase [Planctomycetota bacterium]
MNKDDKRSVLLTGVTRGLGAAMLEKFLSMGHSVAGCGRSKDKIDALSKRYPGAHLRAVDVSDFAAVSQWKTAVLADMGTPDLLLNNAALINENLPLWEVPVDEFAAVIDVNIKGVFHVVKAFTPAMIEAGHGVIVNFSSGWGRSTAADVAPYCATKWAIEGLSAALAQDLPSGISAMAYNPGIIHTEMLESCFGEDAKSFPNPKTWAESQVPYLLSLGAKQNGRPV